MINSGDDGEALHHRSRTRQWVSQYQLPNIYEMEHQTRQSRIPFKSSRSRFGAVVTLLTIAFIVLNLNQGPTLSGYLDSTKIQNEVQPMNMNINHGQGGGLRSLERTKSGNCQKTPFVTPQQAAHSMPVTPAWYPNDQPSHIALCEELVRRNGIVAQRQAQEGGPSWTSPFTTYLIQESPFVCTDWSKPHSAMMQLISSSIVAYVGARFGLEYSHNCHNDLDAEYRHDVPFDLTTVQEIFPELKMPIDQKIIHLGEVVHELCSDCIEGYRNNKHTYGSYEATHHCLAFPDRGAVKLDYVNEQVMGKDGMPQMVEKQELVDSQGLVFHTALESVLPLVRNRLWHAARDWQKEAVIPRGDPKTGVIIYIDAGTSMPIPFNLYTKYIPQYATRVEILSGPNCAAGKLAISMTQLQQLSCLKHAAELRDYLHNFFKDERVDVGFQMISSTAAAYARMIQTNTLLCPPETLSCLLPALAKEKVKDAIIFESPESTTYNWFTYLGTAVQNIKLIKLSHEEMVVDKEQQFIEAKYDGFSVDQVVGRRPAGSYQPMPQFNDKNDNSRANNSNNHDHNHDHSELTSTDNSSSTATSTSKDKSRTNTDTSSSTTKPDLNPTIDSVVKDGHNKNNGQSKEVDIGPVETSHLFDNEGKHSHNHDNHNNAETEITSFPQEAEDVTTGKKAVNSKPVETEITEEYELLEPDKLSDGQINKEEVDVNTAFENGRTSEETNVENPGSLFDREPGEWVGGDTPTETDAQIDYQNLFENWR